MDLDEIEAPWSRTPAEKTVSLLDDAFLEDLGSTNGTYVNGRLIKKQALSDGDEIIIGKYKLVFYSAEASVSPSLEHRRTNSQLKCAAERVPSSLARTPCPQNGSITVDRAHRHACQTRHIGTGT